MLNGQRNAIKSNARIIDCSNMGEREKKPECRTFETKSKQILQNNKLYTKKQKDKQTIERTKERKTLIEMRH